MRRLPEFGAGKRAVTAPRLRRNREIARGYSAMRFGLPMACAVIAFFEKGRRCQRFSA